MVSMRRFLFLLTIFAFFSAIPASAQGILPNSFAGWTGTPQAGIPAPVIYNGDHVGSMAAGQQAAARQEYGFVSGEQAAYSRANDKLQVTLYRMKDPSGAFGMYSYLRSPDMPRADVTDHSAMSRERALVLDGNLVLDISGVDLQRWGKDLNALVLPLVPRPIKGRFPRSPSICRRKGSSSVLTSTSWGR